jgi:hypothetical protein
MLMTFDFGQAQRADHLELPGIWISGTNSSSESAGRDLVD